MVKILLDTTYLLPIFRIRVRLERYEEVFPQLLEGYDVLYTPLSLVEAKWVVLSISRGSHSERERYLEAFRRGLKALLHEERLTQTIVTSPEIERVADVLLIKGGIKDYFDRMIYATATFYDAALLTEDERLARLVVEGAPRPREVLCWRDLLKMLVT